MHILHIQIHHPDPEKTLVARQEAPKAIELVPHLIKGVENRVLC